MRFLENDPEYNALTMLLDREQAQWLRCTSRELRVESAQMVTGSRRLRSHSRQLVRTGRRNVLRKSAAIRQRMNVSAR